MRGRLPSCTAAEVAGALEHGGFKKIIKDVGLTEREFRDLL